LVLSCEDFNSRSLDVVLIAISSNILKLTDFRPRGVFPSGG
jgi:hypothetical protein